MIFWKRKKIFSKIFASKEKDRFFSKEIFCPFKVRFSQYKKISYFCP